jgi:hypothetical protein
MKATFTDLQDDDNPRNGQPLAGLPQVLQAIDELRAGERPRMCQVTTGNGDILVVGIGRDFGCVQHSRDDGLPPYLMAVARVPLPAPDELEFAVGGTMTPIDRRYLIPMDQVADLVAQFVASGEISDAVAWEEFDPSRG